MEYEHCVKLPKLAPVQVIKRIRWEKPEVGWFRLNSDESSLGNPGLVGSGRLIRNGDEIEIDAKSIVELLNNPRAVESVVSAVVDDCRYLISQLPRVRVKHYFREANRCADVLARLGSNQENDFLVFRSPPVDILDFLMADANGLYLNRICSEPILAF
ncbi:uncharacterized protein LOC112017742 [Quercus suber]|uniref:uncharacterized protein LOC112017742 n=1 Tax=Quercus suber TaxID=58331 RepID=UPI000CE17F32|nr:uncharacterized protein LOC112017742 [Quercus suber]